MDFIISSIILWPCDWAPEGWLLCNGQELSISQNTVLYSLLGTTYGGDGINNFMLPKMQNVTTASGGELRYIMCQYGAFPHRQ